MSVALVESVAGFVLLVIAAFMCYLIPAAIHSRQMLDQGRLDDRFSTGLRVLARAGEAPPIYDSTARVRLHPPRTGESEESMDPLPLAPVSRSAAHARRAAAVRAARAAAASRRAAAARRRRVLLAVLLVFTAAGWALFATIAVPVAAPVAASVLLLGAGVAGRRAAVRAARADARDRAQIRRLEQAEPGRGGRGALASEPTTTGAGRAELSPKVGLEPSKGAVAASGGTNAHPDPGDSDREATASLRISVDPEKIEEADGQREWTPVPVPAPTYTLKAPAPRRQMRTDGPGLAEDAHAQDGPGVTEDGHTVADAQATLAEVEESVRRQQGAQASVSTKQEGGQAQAQRVDGAEDPVAASKDAVEGTPPPPSGIDLQQVLERRRAVGD